MSGARATEWMLEAAGRLRRTTTNLPDPAPGEILVSTIEDLLKQEKPTAAAETALKLIELYPQYVKGWLLFGHCRSLIADYAGSNDAYRRALELGADPEIVRPRLAYNHLRLGEYEEARTSYGLVLQSKPNDPDALEQMAFVEGKLENYDAAAQYYRKALEASPDDADLLLGLARVEAKRGGNGSVKALLEKALLLEPDNPEILARLGVIYMKEKDYQAALVPLTKLVATEPDNAKAHRNLAATYYELDDKQRALDSFEKAMALNGHHNGDMDDLYGPLSDCYLASGKKSEALGVIQEGLDKGVQRAWLYSLWGKILEGSKDYDGAIGKFSEAARLHEEPWSDYAKKQIARQSELKKREKMMAGQIGE